jgi:hypothetical protein
MLAPKFGRSAEAGDFGVEAGSFPRQLFLEGNLLRFFNGFAVWKTAALDELIHCVLELAPRQTAVVALVLRNMGKHIVIGKSVPKSYRIWSQ